VRQVSQGVRGEGMSQPSFVAEPVTPVRVTATCPDCGSVLFFSGIVLTCHPPRYPHNCNKCGVRFDLEHVYPRIEYPDAVKE